LRAREEVSDGLAARGTYDDQVAATERYTAAQQRSLELSDFRYRNGVDNYLTVLTAQTGYRGGAIGTMNNTAWQSARRRVGLRAARIHDLRHTYGGRLRAAGVSEEDRAALLGHACHSMPGLYASPDISRLVSLANRVLERRCVVTIVRISDQRTRDVAREVAPSGAVQCKTGSELGQVLAFPSAARVRSAQALSIVLPCPR
jgi:integrase